VGGQKMAMAQIPAVSQVFRAVTVTAVVRSPTLATSVTGGVLRRAILPVPGTATWFTALAMFTGTTTISTLGSLSVASGINLPACRQTGLIDLTI